MFMLLNKKSSKVADILQPLHFAKATINSLFHFGKDTSLKTIACPMTWHTTQGQLMQY